jgi:hypothetical protein
LTEVGISTIPADEYQADPCERPSLSASIAHLLCTRSPAHARAAHPKLNPDLRRAEKEHYDVGTAAHAMLLEGRDAVVVVDAPNWRTKAAQDERDAARAAGQVPLLLHVLEEVEAMVAAAREQLAAHRAQPPLFSEGKPEQTLVWEEPGGVLCRARLDWLRDDGRTVDDLKTTSRSANPESYSRTLFGVGGDVQAAFYVRGVERLTGIVPEFRWCVVETAPPYALSVVSPAPDMLLLGADKVEYAIKAWQHCLERDEWPAYPTEVCYAQAPPWEETRWLEKDLREAA